MIKAEIAFSQEYVFNNFIESFSIEGKDVLEVGGHLSENLIKRNRCNSWIAIDPRNKNETLSDSYKSIQGYAQLIPYEDNSFDFIFSCNAFQHIRNFDMAMKEMYRTLKPGGILYSNFGPIWSAPDGSHIENVTFNNKVYNFWEEDYIPDWYHLVYSIRELYEILSTKLDQGLAKALAEYIHMSDWLNRLGYDEYKKCIENSEFGSVIFFGANIEKGYSPGSRQYDNKYQNKFDQWMKRNNNLMQEYKYRDLLICLKK